MHTKDLPSLDRLTLNVSNVCNMGCRYCFANQGKYDSAGLLMDKNTALEAVNFVSRNFSRVRHVSFFGGEPTLNLPIMHLICEYFRYLNKTGVTDSIPRFGMTTNGLMLDNDTLGLIDKYELSVCVSIDGPEDIHNRLRVDKEKRGTYREIEKNVALLARNEVELEFECTYTSEHLKHGYDLVTLMDFFHNQFDCQVLHAPFVSVNDNSSLFLPLDVCLELQRNAILYSLDNMKNGISSSISTVDRLMKSIGKKKRISHYCPAGKTTITINADGTLYSCFMLIQEELKLGDVRNASLGFRPSEALLSILDEADKQKNHSCLNCKAQALCFGCIGEDLTRTRGKFIRSETPGISEICDYKRAIVEIFLSATMEFLDFQ